MFRDTVSLFHAQPALKPNRVTLLQLQNQQLIESSRKLIEDKFWQGDWPATIASSKMKHLLSDSSIYRYISMGVTGSMAAAACFLLPVIQKQIVPRIIATLVKCASLTDDSDTHTKLFGFLGMMTLVMGASAFTSLSYHDNFVLNFLFPDNVLRRLYDQYEKNCIEIKALTQADQVAPVVPSEKKP